MNVYEYDPIKGVKLGLVGAHKTGVVAHRNHKVRAQVPRHNLFVERWDVCDEFIDNRRRRILPSDFGCTCICIDVGNIEQDGNTVHQWIIIK